MTQRSKTELEAQITTLLADNNAGDISAADLRSVLDDVADSIVSWGYGRQPTGTIPGVLLGTLLQAIDTLASLPGAGERKLMEFTETGVTYIDIPSPGATLAAVLTAINALTSLPSSPKIIRLSSSGAALVDESVPTTLAAVLTAINTLTSLPSAGQTKLVQLTSSGATLIDVPSGGSALAAVANAINQLTSLPSTAQLIQITNSGASLITAPISATRANVYQQVKDIILQGNHVTVTDNDTAQTVTIASTGGVGPTPTNHHVAAGWSADQIPMSSELTSSTSGQSTDTVTVPTQTTDEYLILWRADADGGDPTEVHIDGDQRNARNLFGTAVNLIHGGEAGKAIVSGLVLRARIYSGLPIRMI